MWKSNAFENAFGVKFDVMVMPGDREETAFMITSEDISIDLRLAKPGGNVKAFADVTVALGESGVLSISGFSVVGSSPRVVPPARKGDQRYFDVVLLTGKVKTLVYTMIGMAYKKALADSAKGAA